MQTHHRIVVAAGFAAALAALAASAHAPPARAGGFEIPENGTVALGRGGAFVARGDDPTALVLNPGALVRMSGTHLLYNHVFVWEHSTFTRQASQLPPGTDYGFDPLAPVSNADTLFPLGGMIIATTDFGLEDWTFAAGVYGPNAHGSKDYPLAGGQRYLLTHLDAVLFYPSLAVAYGDRKTFGIGATLQAVLTPSLAMSLVVDGSQAGGLHAYYSGNDVEARIEMKDMTSFSAIVGAWWRPIPELELGVSGRVVPAALNLAGKFSLHNVPGQTQFSDQQLSVPGSAARLDLTLPPTAKIGARWVVKDGDHEDFDLELDLGYEAWSMLERYAVELDGTINLFVGAEAPDAIIEKRWRDTFSARLGGTWSAWHGALGGSDGELQLSFGGFFETAAVPHGYEHLDFLSFQRVGLALGVAGKLGPLKLTLAYSHVFQEDRKVDERFGKVFQQRPLDPCPERCDGGAGWSGVPANAGLFESGYDLFSAGLEAAF
ncbi:MAG: outer membrane protein transport protein [Myxococcota bacterium]